MRGQMYHCHAFVKALRPLIEAKAESESVQVDLVERAEELLTWEKKTGDGSVERSVVNAEFESVLKLAKPNTAASRSYERAIDRAVKAVKYVGEDAQRLYFGQARRYQAARVLDTTLPAKKGKGGARLEVIDLPSLPDRATRLLAIDAILANEWERVRDEWSRALLKPAPQDKRVPVRDRRRSAQPNSRRSAIAVRKSPARAVSNDYRRGTKIRSLLDPGQPAAGQAGSVGAIGVREQGDHEAELAVRTRLDRPDSGSRGLWTASHVESSGF